MKEQILKSLTSLGKIRSIFHSEDDFKFSFSKIFQEELGEDYEIRLERPEEIEMLKRDGSLDTVRAPIDIVVINTKTKLSYPIELKYKTKKFETGYDHEEYKLSAHGANDLGRFSFRKDIYRLEHIVEKKDKSVQGFFIVITNDEKYWDDDVSIKNTLDKNYSFHNGAILHAKDLGWNDKKLLKCGWAYSDENKLLKDKRVHWTSKGDWFYQLDLKNTYTINWEKYSKIEEEDFCVSVIDISIQS